MADDYVPDKLFARLFQPWTLPEAEWPLCREDWERVNLIASLPWMGTLLDFGAGDGTVAAMVCSRNPRVKGILCVEQDVTLRDRAWFWHRQFWPIRVEPTLPTEGTYDGALCCEVLEHLTSAAGVLLLKDIHAVLKPGGMLCVTVPHKARSRATYPGHITDFTTDRLLEVVRAAGFIFFEDSWCEIGFMENYESVPDEMELPWIWAVARA
jgi:SAM-dependent methyltransferase